MPKNDRDVFVILTSRPDQLEIGLLAYAEFARLKEKFLLRRTKIRGTEPTDTDISSWIEEEFDDDRIENLKKDAFSYFEQFALSLQAQQIDIAKKELAKTEMMQAIRDSGALHKQIITSVITALLTPVVIGIVILSYNVSAKYIPLYFNFGMG